MNRRPLNPLTVLFSAIALSGCLLLGIGCRGCNSAPPTTPPVTTTITAEQLDDIFEAEGIGGIEIAADRLYAVPSLSWFRDSFPRAWFVFADNLGLWAAEARDCDDFARGAAFHAQWLHSITANAPPGTALAIGEFWYQRENGGPHAILAGICRVDGTTNLVIAFMEPQNPPRAITLSAMEYTSCYVRRF